MASSVVLPVHHPPSAILHPQFVAMASSRLPRPQSSPLRAASNALQTAVHRALPHSGLQLSELYSTAPAPVMRARPGHSAAQARGTGDKHLEHFGSGRRCACCERPLRHEAWLAKHSSLGAACPWLRLPEPPMCTRLPRGRETESLLSTAHGQSIGRACWLFILLSTPSAPSPAAAHCHFPSTLEIHHSPVPLSFVT